MKTIELNVPKSADERVAEEDANKECQCPICGRLHRKLGNPPEGMFQKEAAEV